MSAPFKIGDVVQCVNADWTDPYKARGPVPKVGDVFRIVEIETATLDEDGWDGVTLGFGDFDLWNAARFRKIENDTGYDFRTQLKSLGKPKERVS